MFPERANGRPPSEPEKSIGRSAAEKFVVSEERGLMTTYGIKWEIEIDAETPEEAARKALEIQRDPQSIYAMVFDVCDERGNTTRVDLLEQ